MSKIATACLLIALIFWSCSDNSPTEPEKVELEAIDDVLPNPFKGFAPWIGSSNPVFEAKLQVATFAWRELEPTKGAYKWSRLERNWGNVSETGKRVGFRVAAEIPGSGENDTPQWLIDEGVEMRPYSIDGLDGQAPDWDDPKFLDAHREFILALGVRYDQDPRVAWIDIGSYGFWGEWHVFQNPHLAATQTTKETILEHYFEAFPTKQKVIAFDDDFATEYVTERGGGVRNDCLGTADANNWYEESLNRIDPGLQNRIWKKGFITGEFCGGQAGALAGTTDRFDLNFQFVKDNHWSFIGPAGGAIQPTGEQHRQNLELLHKTLGYRFVLKTVEHDPTVAAGGGLQVKIVVENQGVAPFYFEWPLVIYLVGEDGTDAAQVVTAVDVRVWLPGLNTSFANVDIPSDLASGEYDIKVAIHDPETGFPGVLFANQGRDDNDRYLVSRLRIK